ncbi:hypothetical protein MGYG_07829 [Nannizzia gypsea CBS 118893]|uniref:Uncharacterized protein n=1 Tax=Arthroderma gypseum (strain ATCC MYA-4604 / CBS 118893) TaxID=535722 RepID=E4V499_ARTGP|nr:hypothetical protein MGYG_07829 [Nannizzia gypsea CBS 118893]EFR04823.1 hypothetical protein MGYG_07829 [Nannizzia gypsea CBS 118893]
MGGEMKINTERTVDTKRNQPRKEDAGAEPARKRGRPGSFKEAKQAGSPRGEKGPPRRNEPQRKRLGEARGGKSTPPVPRQSLPLKQTEIEDDDDEEDINEAGGDVMKDKKEEEMRRSIGLGLSGGDLVL